MSSDEGWRALTDIDFALAEARTNWHHNIYEAASWPTVPGFVHPDMSEAEAINLKIDEQHQYLTDVVSFEISRVLFQFYVHGPTTMSEMEVLLKNNNASLESCLHDKEFYRRTRIKPERIKDRILSDSTIRNSAIMVGVSGQPVINATVLASLMCRIASKSTIDACLRVFEEARLIQVAPTGPNNTKVINDWAPLNEAFALYLREVQTIIGQQDLT